MAGASVGGLDEEALAGVGAEDAGGAGALQGAGEVVGVGVEGDDRAAFAGAGELGAEGAGGEGGGDEGLVGLAAAAQVTLDGVVLVHGGAEAGPVAGEEGLLRLAGEAGDAP